MASAIYIVPHAPRQQNVSPPPPFSSQQLDRISRFQFKKKDFSDFPTPPAAAKTLVMGIDDFSAPWTIPDLNSPYFALRQWLLETAPDPQLRKWLLETTTDNSVRLQLLQQQALDRASSGVVCDAELLRWYNRESEELRRREEVIAKRKRREEINAALQRDAEVREERRRDSFAKTAAKRKELATPAAAVLGAAAGGGTAKPRSSKIQYFDDLGIETLRDRSHFVKTKALNCVDVADTLFAKRGTATVAVASAGNDADVNTRRREHQRPHTAGPSQHQSRAFWPPDDEPVAAAAAVSRRPHTATAKFAVVSTRRSLSPDAGDDTLLVSDGSEDSLAVAGRRRPQSGTRIRDSLPVYRLPSVAAQSEQRPKTAPPRRLRSSSPKRSRSPVRRSSPLPAHADHHKETRLPRADGALRPTTAGPILGAHRSKPSQIVHAHTQRPSSSGNGGERQREQLQEMFGRDLIHRLDSVVQPKRRGDGGRKGKERSDGQRKTNTWRI